VLEDSINSVRAGNELTPEAPAKPEVKAEEKPGETPAAPAPETPVEDPSKPPVSEPKEPAAEFRIPNKGKFESDESYEKRIELFDLVKARKQATTPEAKKQLNEEISKVKGQLKNLNGTSDSINNLNSVPEKKVEEEDPVLKADKERLKALGGATVEDIQGVIQQERFAADQRSTLESFVKRHAELADVDVREVFFDFIDANFVWQNKGGKELMTVLELAAESMFKPSETVQERVLKGANVQEKVNAMQFPGGTGGSKGSYTPEQRKSIDELKATGMTEEKAVELISE
jgi:hypothetical protein